MSNEKFVNVISINVTENPNISLKELKDRLLEDTEGLDLSKINVNIEVEPEDNYDNVIFSITSDK